MSVEGEGPDMAEAGADKLVVRDIGLMLSGDLAKPILDADTIVAEGGGIVAVGKAADIDTGGAAAATRRPRRCCRWSRGSRAP